MMRDLVFLLVAVGFFALAFAYVRGCARLVGELLDGDVRADLPDEQREVAP